MFKDSYTNKVVWLSGSTGFKGSWLAEWLLHLGATVHGFALPPNTRPSLFHQLSLESNIQQEFADIRNLEAVCRSIQQTQPDFVFHLAAQPLVRASYDTPVETYATNVMGTVHVLEALRQLEKPCAAVIVTTDKCYENREWIYGYREDDPLGGFDPYSSSKAAAEMAIAAYRHSFFQKHLVKIASARAGNVIGGGDWAKDRIVPDCIRALQNNQPIAVRNRNATRPWQHVLEPLSGYLWLAVCLSQLSAFNPQLCGAFNFGPTHESNRNVGQLVEEILKHWPGSWEDKSDTSAVHEAGLLQLSVNKAYVLLNWSPVWNFLVTVQQTVQWYRDAADKRTLTTNQISRYVAEARALGLPWAQP